MSGCLFWLLPSFTQSPPPCLPWFSPNTCSECARALPPRNHQPERVLRVMFVSSLLFLPAPALHHHLLPLFPPSLHVLPFFTFPSLPSLPPHVLIENLVYARRWRTQHKQMCHLGRLSSDWMRGPFCALLPFPAFGGLSLTPVLLSRFLDTGPIRPGLCRPLQAR